MNKRTPDDDVIRRAFENERSDMTEWQQVDEDMKVAETLYEMLQTDDGDTNLADAVGDVARALQPLGTADAATLMGALEAHGAAMLEASENIARGLDNIAGAIAESTR